MTHHVLGVIGHVDHGKTTLVGALTGQDTDRLREEKLRGISIALGFAHFEADGATVDLIDMPGHERFVRTMISGATGIDAVLLVVAANEGIKPQSIEHIDIAGLLGVRRAVVAITKCDLADRVCAERVAADAVARLAAAGLEAMPPVLTSAQQGVGLAELEQAIVELAGVQAAPRAEGAAFLPIDRAFTIAGHGPVVTGTLRGAAVSTGDKLVLWPAGREVRVRMIQVHGQRVVSSAPGHRVAINLRGAERSELDRGMALAAPDTLAPAEWVTIAIRAVDTQPAGAPSLKNGLRLRALVGTQDVDVRLRLLDRDVLGSGEQGFAQLKCATPIIVPAGEHVILRTASPARTVAGGRVLEPETRRQKRHSAIVLPRLERLRDASLAAVIEAEVRDSARAPTTLQQLSRLLGLATWRIGEELARLDVIVTRSGLVIQRLDLDRLLARITTALAAHRDGLTLDRLRAALPGTHALVFEEALVQALSAGTVRKRGNLFAIPRQVDDAARARAMADLGECISQMLQQAGLTPPTPREIVSDAESSRVVERLLRTGVLIRAVDRAKGKEILFHRQAVADAQARLAPLLACEPGLLVTDIAAALGISRKYAMPLLDHLDSIRFTRRQGDYRRLWQTDSMS